MTGANNSGLMVGDVWARSLTTGVDQVMQTSDFSAMVSSQFGSQLAETNLGKLGLLPAAGSGAEYYNTTSGNTGTVTLTPQVNATVNVQVDGTPLQVVAQQVVDASMTNLVNSIGAQRSA